MKSSVPSRLRRGPRSRLTLAAAPIAAFTVAYCTSAPSVVRARAGLRGPYEWREPDSALRLRSSRRRQQDGNQWPPRLANDVPGHASPKFYGWNPTVPPSSRDGHRRPSEEPATAETLASELALTPQRELGHNRQGRKGRTLGDKTPRGGLDNGVRMDKNQNKDIKDKYDVLLQNGVISPKEASSLTSEEKERLMLLTDGKFNLDYTGRKDPNVSAGSDGGGHLSDALPEQKPQSLLVGTSVGAGSTQQGGDRTPAPTRRPTKRTPRPLGRPQNKSKPTAEPVPPLVISSFGSSHSNARRSASQGSEDENTPAAPLDGTESVLAISALSSTQSKCLDAGTTTNSEEDVTSYDSNRHPSNGYYYPDFSVNSCGFGHDFPAWMGFGGYEKWYLFAKGEHCCSNYFPTSSKCPHEDKNQFKVESSWEKYQDNLPSGKVRPAPTTHTFYPDMKAGTCINGTDYPTWMASKKEYSRLYLYKNDPQGCCKYWFGDTSVDSCVQRIIRSTDCIQAATGMAVNKTAEYLNMWYPVIKEHTCKQDKSMPSWMRNEGYIDWYLFHTRQHCCAAFDLC